MKIWISRLALLLSLVTIAGIAVSSISSAAPRTPRSQLVCRIVKSPPSVPCGQFYNLIRSCSDAGRSSWVVIGRRQNICSATFGPRR
jgi:hypothetical protein